MNYKLLLLIFVNKVKWEQPKNEFPLYLISIDMAYFSTRLNKLTVKEEIKQEKVNHMITSIQVYGKKIVLLLLK